MDGRIIAGRFIQSKAKGRNGKIATHLADDPLSGDRVVVKVFSEEDPLILEYVKAMNILNDHGCRGMVLPLEGGMLEEEPGYYQAYPEVPGPILEEYVSLNPSMEAGELERLLSELEATLKDLHSAGFTHLFLSPRNIFYSPGRPVYTKDPALTCQLYSFFMQELEGFDYSFFSPHLMDGGEGGPAEDFFSLGRTVLAVMEKVELVGDEALGKAVRERASIMVGEGGAGPVADAAARPGRHEERAAAESAPRFPQDPEVEEAEEAEEPGPPENARHDRLRIDLASLALDESGGGVPGGRRGPAPREPKKLLRGAAIILLVLCAGAVLAYGLPQRAGEGASSSGQETGRLTLEEEAAETDGGAGDAPTAGSAEDLAAVAEPVMLDGPEQAASGGEQAAPAEDQGGGVASAGAGEPARANQRPVASFSASPSQGASPLQVYLDGSSSYDPDGSIVSYQWSCGGGGAAVYRVFESSVIPSRVSVVLTVTDDCGASSSTERVITLY